MIDNYLRLFQKLRTDKNKNRWPALTTFRAPHKPFLLLSIMDLISQGQIASNFIEPGFDLVETFNQYWASIMPFGKSSSMAYPFYHMSNEPFWELILRPGAEVRHGETFSSMKRIREVYLGAKLDDGLFSLFLDSVTRERLRATLITTYFLPECHDRLIQQGMVNCESYQYSKVLLERLEGGEAGWEQDAIPTDATARDQGFRKAIMILYEHRCAMCGIRIFTPEGHTVVEAAHIKPWSLSKNDLPVNGMSLCRLCHWSFDEGLMSVSKSYEVLISRQVNQERNLPGHMQALTDRPIFRPKEEKFWPGKDNLAWHRRERFRK